MKTIIKTSLAPARCGRRVLAFCVISGAWAGLMVNAVAAEARKAESPFVVQGKITDFAGNPVAGVEVQASCGNGSLFHTGTTKSDDDGKYRLAFGPGIRIGNTPLGIGTQAATISPRLKGWYEIHLARRGNLMMTEWKDQPATGNSTNFAGVVVANEPYELNFTMAEAAAIEGRFVNEFDRPLAGIAINLTGDSLPPSCSILAAATTDDQGRFTFDSVPIWLGDPSTRLNWRFTMRPFGVRHELESSSFEVSDQANSIQKLTLESDGDNHEVRLLLKREVVDAQKL